jgi:hypothetical protein
MGAISWAYNKYYLAKQEQQVMNVIAVDLSEARKKTPHLGLDSERESPAKTALINKVIEDLGWDKGLFGKAWFTESKIRLIERLIDHRLRAEKLSDPNARTGLARRLGGEDKLNKEIGDAKTLVGYVGNEQLDLRHLDMETSGTIRKLSQIWIVVNSQANRHKN